ncbi:flavodoxin family protein [Halodesulfovibrio aestuarii]|uniref:Flavodoxin family protein n=1 Tax=Halodesulfovibrio aestuarii TaxID=126333 RepID=A0ABV4JS76_9BACT
MNSTQSFTNALQILGCSARKNGNTDAAAKLFAQGYEAAGGHTQTQFMRDYTIRHCTACEACAVPGSTKCVQEDKDDSAELYSMLLEAPAIFISSPIYFYHLPSIFKTFIDRCQCFWFRKHNRDPFVLSLPPRKAYICLVAARPVGAQLFQGSLLTLKYFLSPFNIRLAEPLLIYGKDGPTELASDPMTVEQILEYAKAACNDTVPLYSTQK